MDRVIEIKKTIRKRRANVRNLKKGITKLTEELLRLEPDAKELSKLPICPICFDLIYELKFHVRLDCSHHLCMYCFNKMLVVGPIRELRFSCPLCRSSTSYLMTTTNGDDKTTVFKLSDSPFVV